MKRNNSKRHKGFSLIEVILSLAILALLTTTYVTSLLDNEMNIYSNTKRSTANNLAREGVEAIYNIKDNSFISLVDGSYGLSTEGNKISLIQNNDTSSNYTRTLTISTINPRLKKVEVNVSWLESNGRLNNIDLVTYMSNQTK